MSKPKYLPTNNAEITIKGKKSELVEEVVKLQEKNKTIQTKLKNDIKPLQDKAFKAISKNSTRIAEISNEIKKLIKKDGKYVDENLNTLLVATTDSFSPPSPQDVKNWLKDHRRGKEFYGLVKVQLGLLRKAVPDADIDKMKSVKKTGSTTKYTFKKG